MREQFYWVMRGALCMERIQASQNAGFDTSADAERELIHVEHMLEGEKWLLDPFYCHPRKDGESTTDWVERAQDEFLAEIISEEGLSVDELHYT